VLGEQTRFSPLETTEPEVPTKPGTNLHAAQKQVDREGSLNLPIHHHSSEI
jgi:hypothetical protein